MNVNSLSYITFSFDFAARHHITEGYMFGVIIICGFFAWIDCMIKKSAIRKICVAFIHPISGTSLLFDQPFYYI